MPSFSYMITGDLTKKQEQILRTVDNIVSAFYDEDEKIQRRTWAELKRLTRLSSGALSKHLKELIRQSVVEGKVKVNDKNRLQTFYEYTEEFFSIEGKAEPSLVPLHIFYTKGDKAKSSTVQAVPYFKLNPPHEGYYFKLNPKVYFRLGYVKKGRSRGKSKSYYFVDQKES